LANLSSSSARRARKVAFSAMKWDFDLGGIYTPQCTGVSFCRLPMM
jgi:hypothetical protein